ncbi:MAG: hypothetical protein AB7O04_02875 [Hyphomonadaceae bacterium]
MHAMPTEMAVWMQAFGAPHAERWIAHAQAKLDAFGEAFPYLVCNTRDAIGWAIDRAVILAAAGGLLLLWAHFAFPRSARSEPQYSCPNVEVRLNAYEYELQRRTCIAYASRAGDG